MTQDAVEDKHRQYKADYVASTSWWRAFILTFVHTARVRGEISLRPPDEYGPMKRFLVLFPQNRDPYSGKFNWLPTIVVGTCSLSTMLVLSIVIHGAGIVPGLIVLSVAVVAAISCMVKSYVTFFKAGGWEQVLEGRDRRKGKLDGRRADVDHHGQKV